MSTPAERIRSEARLDDGSETTFLGCMYCEHFRPYGEGKPWCAAFPEGIPTPILVGQVDHLEERFDQDNDIVFEEVPRLNDFIESGYDEERRLG